MIVKDEAHVITRAFDSVKDFVDYYIICDTGSTDGTQEVIQSYWEEHGLQGEIHQHKWVNFGRNRTQCFDLAKGKSDYIMTLDADEVIAPFKDGKENLFSKVAELPTLSGDIVFATTILGTQRYQRHQFFRNALPWSWSEPVHEVCNAEGNTTRVFLEDLCCVASAQDGARSRDSSKFLRDAGLFEEHLLSNPEDARSWFYLAQSYGDGGRLDRAIEAADGALKFLTWDQEIYITLLRKARWKFAQSQDITEVTHDYLRAYAAMPHRAEALYDLLRYYSALGDYHTAVLFGETAINCNYPPVETLFVEHDVYSWRLKDLLSVAYYYTGQKEAGLDLTKDLLESEELPEEHRARVENNLLEFEK